MRTGLIIAALASAAALCACDHANEREVSADPSAISTVALPFGFTQTIDESAPTEYGELNIAGRFIVENRLGSPVNARLRFRDWGRGLEDVEGETVEVTIPARGRLSTNTIGRNARAVSMFVEGAGIISQSHHRFEHLGARVVLDPSGAMPIGAAGEIFIPAIDDQLAMSPEFIVDSASTESLGTLRVGDFFRAVNETGVAIPLEFEFRHEKDNTSHAFGIAVVLPARGEALLPVDERYGAVTVRTPTVPLQSGYSGHGSITTGPKRIRAGRVVEYRISGKGEGGTVLEVSETRD
jgi:hypothetical protein